VRKYDTSVTNINVIIANNVIITDNVKDY